MGILGHGMAWNGLGVQITGCIILAATALTVAWNKRFPGVSGSEWGCS